MADRVIVLNGGGLYHGFTEDLAQMLDHQYDVDEIYLRYADWCRRGEMSVNEYTQLLFPINTTAQADNQIEDDHVALRNAMINLYCAIDRNTPGLDRRSVLHAAYCTIDEALVITTR